MGAREDENTRSGRTAKSEDKKLTQAEQRGRVGSSKQRGISRKK